MSNIPVEETQEKRKRPRLKDLFGSKDLDSALDTIDSFLDKGSEQAAEFFEKASDGLESLFGTDFANLSPDEMAEALEREVRKVKVPHNIEETEQAIILRAEVPNFKKEDIKIEGHGNRIEVSGKRKLSRPAEGKFLHREIRSGNFRIKYLYPCAVDERAVSAIFGKNGTLTLTIPKKFHHNEGVGISID